MGGLHVDAESELIAEREVRQLIVLHGDSAYVLYVCMYVCMYVGIYVCMYACMYVGRYVRNATGIQLLQTYFLWAWHCFHSHAVEPVHALRSSHLQRGDGE